jgi:hypothetical protein
MFKVYESSYTRIYFIYLHLTPFEFAVNHTKVALHLKRSPVHIVCMSTPARIQHVYRALTYRERIELTAMICLILSVFVVCIIM